MPATERSFRINIGGALNPELITAGDQAFYIIGEENIVRWEDTSHFFPCGCHFIRFDSANLYYNLIDLLIFCRSFCPWISRH